ncbi:GDP-mannose 4,6-dehydratase, partial [Candidatus Pacearchaeota archaeon]|nr:GDP-mannose 4,6-dehydratase [Candidatus Pacearchaeota archaeon]
MTDKPKTALITGITGQDGSYLADFLLQKGYHVVGIKRRTSLLSTDRIDHIFNDMENVINFDMAYGNMIDAGNIYRLLQETQPDEIYNLAA